MNVEKKVLANLEKCYSIAPLHYNGEDCILVAAEKTDPCLLFDKYGNQKEVVWEQPGGTMSMVQVPESNGVFLATHKFYSPNDSKDAKIVCVRPQNGKWEINTLLPLPFVHRFDIIRHGDTNYLIACALKSGHEYKDDWTHPGAVYACELPDDLSVYSDENPLVMQPIRENMTKNHGYYKISENGEEAALISCQEGVFLFTPPVSKGECWNIQHLLQYPSSDAVLLDLDGDGQKELAVISQFHGDVVKIYHEFETGYKEVYSYDKAEFAHAIYGGELCGRQALVIGHRKGTRDLLEIHWDTSKKDYTLEKIDENCGPANVYRFFSDGADVLISTNREINEIAMYTIQK